MTSRLIATLATSTCLSTCLFYGVMLTPALAITPIEIKNAEGDPFITLRFFNVGDGAYGFGDLDGRESTWDLTDWQVDQIVAATQYWSEIIKVVPGQNPAIINVGTFDEMSAAASSWNATTQDGSPSAVGGAITNKPVDDMYFDAHGFILVGTFDWERAPYSPSHIALAGETSLSTVLIHEITHALGVGSNNRPIGYDDDNLPQMMFASGFDVWSSHLRDDNGKAAAAGQVILCKVCATPPAGLGLDTFDARLDQVYFSGTHVDEVLKGSMKGLPMKVATDYGPIDLPLFSHIELKNSLMSHQYYRNYNTLMEAELAALQDIGYTIDRRNFYGNSVYGDGLTLTNDNPFHARNADGTTYIPNTYNTATLGLGLHIYGSNNNITQNADLLSAGAGGGGIRVDGAGNNLTIGPDTRVYADGTNGRGIMYAYGKDHTLNHRGDIQALGENGIAVSFDFGHNTRGDLSGKRGSYILYAPESTPDEYAVILAELQGALVEKFDLTGRVAGSKAAIFMSENALVNQINVMQGASITGDIISNYQEKDENGDLRLTSLNFGLEADSNGHATSTANDEFTLTYADNIKGSNIALQFAGGTTQLSGDHDIFNVAIAQSAKLSGQGSYQINAAEQFLNSGILNPSIAGAAITIHGDYAQSADGTLQLAFNGEKDISSLIVNGDANIDGTISFAPLKDWYSDGFALTSNEWLSATLLNGQFSAVTTTLTSPTLQATATDNGQNSYTVSLSRAENAYSQYADNSNGEAVGFALDAVANTASLSLQNLIASLDFSAGNGSDIQSALPQLSAEAHASAMGVLANSGAASRSAANNRLLQAFGGTPNAPISVMNYMPTTQPVAAVSAINSVTQQPDNSVNSDHFVGWGSTFGSFSVQSGSDNAGGIETNLGGFATGIDAATADNWRIGAMLGYSRSNFKLGANGSSGSSDNYTLGAYAGTEWEVADGAIGLRTGLTYAWHDVDMNRSVAFADFQDSLSAAYSAGTFQMFGELGYKLDITSNATFEPYANLASVHLNTNGFVEKGQQGAALAVHSGAMNNTISTLGMRFATDFDLGELTAVARADLGWRHAYGDITPSVTANFAGGSNAFTALGTPIGRDTALLEAGVDLQFNPNTVLGLTYQGQFGSGLSQNSINANLSVKF